MGDNPPLFNRALNASLFILLYFLQLQVPLCVRLVSAWDFFVVISAVLLSRAGALAWGRSEGTESQSF